MKNHQRRRTRQSQKKRKDGFSSGRGHNYEYKMCMLYVFRGLAKKLTNFRLRYQVREAGIFDDVVFDLGGENYQVLQLKHRQNLKDKICSERLLNSNIDDQYFNLLKSVKSLIDINSRGTLKDKVKMAVLFTTIDFDFKKDKKDSTKLSLKKSYKFGNNEVTDIQLEPFYPNTNAIFDTSNSFPNAKYYKFHEDPNIINILTTQLVHQSNKMKDALKYIIYAVRQPNDQQLANIIKKEIKDYFHFNNELADRVYNDFNTEMMNWCIFKDPFTGQTFDERHVIQFKNADKFFQTYVKKVFLGEKPPSSSFTGHEGVLNSIREELKKKHEFIIYSLEGMGKTELVKQFIKKYGESDFYGRVIWINAECDDSVKNSFLDLAKKISIQGCIYTITIIREIFGFFKDVKVLFVFENFNNRKYFYFFFFI